MYTCTCKSVYVGGGGIGRATLKVFTNLTFIMTLTYATTDFKKKCASILISNRNYTNTNLLRQNEKILFRSDTSEGLL